MVVVPLREYTPSCRTVVSKPLLNTDVVIFSPAVAARYIAIFPVVDVAVALPPEAPVRVNMSELNCSVDDWNHVDETTLVSVV